MRCGLSVRNKDMNLVSFYMYDLFMYNIFCFYSPIRTAL